MGDGERDAAPTAELVREGEYWTVAFRDAELRVRDSKGMRYLAELIAHPGRETEALALAGASSTATVTAAEAADAGLISTADTDLGPRLDAHAKRVYGERLKDLRGEIDQADAFHDSERALRARAEYDAILGELSAAAGLGARDRRSGSPSERARLNVTRAIKAAVERIGTQDPELGEQLSVAVHTGRVCVYRPNPATRVSWRVGTPISRRPEVEPFQPPQTHYARSGDVNIGYQVLGSDKPDLVLVPGWISNLDFQWTNPVYTQAMLRLAGSFRLILFDKRGMGVSDPVGSQPTFEERMDDIRAVMDACGSERASILGLSEGGPMGVLFAATYPERTKALVLYGSYACMLGGPDLEQSAASMRRTRDAIAHWGEGRTLDNFAPSLVGNDLARRWCGMFERAAASPAMARAFLDDVVERCDVRAVVPAVAVPTLVIHRRDELAVPFGHGRYLAEHIAGAELVELDGEDHLPYVGDPDAVSDAIEEFLGSVSDQPPPLRALATILVMEFLGPFVTGTQTRIRDTVARSGGRLVRLRDDSLIATFDGPIRAIESARSIRDEAAANGLAIRAGLHVGDCEIGGEQLTGLAVEIATSVRAKADPGDVLISQTVRDLVLGAELRLGDRGEHELPGVPGLWRLFAVANEAEAPAGRGTDGAR